MKKNIFINGALSMVAAAALTACSSDYLELEPVTLVDETVMLSTVDNAQSALRGACRSMYVAYSGVGDAVQFMNGEPFINTLYGEAMASDCYYDRWGTQVQSGYMSNDFLRYPTYWATWMPWAYSYNLINQVNKIIPYIDDAEGDANLGKFVKAEALTLRAHAYTKLIQFYAPRWEDANGGNVDVAPLRLTSSTSDQGYATMTQIVDQIYADLDEAIKLYTESGKSRTYGYEPDIEIARGVYARIAMIIHDWTTAQKMAHDARTDYPIMSGEQYLQGFCDPNSEWMWYNENDAEDSEVGTYSWGASYACNGGYVARWGYGAGAINYELYKKMDTKDIRRKLYWTPDKLSALLRPSYFWNPTYVNEADLSMNILNSQGLETLVTQNLRIFLNNSVPSKGTGYFGTLPYRLDDDPETKLVGCVPFGAQVKFWGAGPYSNTSYPFMRGAELAFIEAEAACMNEQYSTACSILEEVISKRVNGYTCSLTGTALLDEIKTQKRIELWGEGFCWTDLKRWNMPIIRKAWKANDMNSGNIPATMAIDVMPEAHSGWVIITPSSETQYNHDL